MLNLTIVDFMLLGGHINPDRMDGRPGEYDTDYHPSSPQNDPEDADTHAKTIDDDYMDAQQESKSNPFGMDEEFRTVPCM